MVDHRDSSGADAVQPAPSTEQPGYDALAERYARIFPTAFTTILEQHAVEMLLAYARLQHPTPTVIDVGSGIGHVAAHLNSLGARVVGVDPSAEMLRIAHHSHPDLDMRPGDAQLLDVDLTAVSALLARFSLIHLSPAELAATTASWGQRLPPGALVLIATQSDDREGVHEFDHAVARAWRWHPDALAAVMAEAGFTELWRTVSRPDADHRFPEAHLLFHVPR